MTTVIQRVLRWAAAQSSTAAVVRTGSRAGRGPVDALSDHDLILFLDDPRLLEEEDGWFHEPGPVLVWIPETVEHLGRTVQTRLVLYEDRTRVDFTLSATEILDRLVGAPSLPPWLDAGYEVLYDRDGRAAELPPPSGRAHVPTPPDLRRFEARVREFWWETTYVARNLAREAPLAARYSLDVVIRHDLLREMLEWYVQGEGEWATPPGAVGRGLPGRLEAEDRRELLAALADGGLPETRLALERTTALYGRLARTVARRLGFPYPERLERGVAAYLEEVLQGSPEA